GGRICKRRSASLGSDDALANVHARFSAGRADGVLGIKAADPGKAKILKHALDIIAIAQAVREAAGSAKAGGRNADASAQRRSRECDVLADHLVHGLALDEPRATAKAKLDRFEPFSFHVDVI